MNERCGLEAPAIWSKDSPEQTMSRWEAAQPRVAAMTEEIDWALLGEQLSQVFKKYKYFSCKGMLAPYDC